MKKKNRTYVYRGVNLKILSYEVKQTKYPFVEKNINNKINVEKKHSLSTKM